MKIKILAFFIIISFIRTTYAQIAQLDPTFNVGTGFNGSIYAIKMQKDGKILVGGDFTSFNGTTVNRLARLNANGSLDESFNTLNGFDNAVYTIDVQEDGRILAGGLFYRFNNENSYLIARLNENGSRDANFDLGNSGFRNTTVPALGAVRKIVCLPNGKILVGGNFNRYKTTNINNIARINSDGSIDPDFKIGTGFNNQVMAILPQTDGSMFVGGNFLTFNDLAAKKFVKLKSDGTLDESFKMDFSFFDGVVNCLAQNGNKIHFGGNFSLFYKGPGTQPSYFGSFDISNETLPPFASSNFRVSSMNTISFVSSINVQTDGKIIVGGIFSYEISAGNNREFLIRLNTDGTIDESFNFGVGFKNNPQKSTLLSTCLQPDGKLLVGGNFSSYSGTSTTNLIRLYTKDVISNTESETSQLYSLSPNPTSGKVNIEFKTSETNVELSLYSLQGKLLDKKRYSGTNQISYELNQEAGTYLIKIQPEGQQKGYTQRVIKF